MDLPHNIKDQLGGTPYINIGDETYAVFVPMSMHLLNIMRRYPLIHSAFVEGAKCAKQGFYAAGILAYSQLLKEFSEEEPEERNRVGHEFLKKPPSQENYTAVMEQFDEVAKKKTINEFFRHQNNEKVYKEELVKQWNALISSYDK